MNSTPFDWKDWYRCFELNEDELAELTNLFPQVLAARFSAVPALALTLSDEVVQNLIAGGFEGTEEELFNNYLDAGELGAATLLLQKETICKDGQEKILNRQLALRQEELELNYRLTLARMERCLTNLVNLTLIAKDDSEFNATHSQADFLHQVKRLSPAIRVLETEIERLQDLENQFAQNLKQDLQELRQQASKDRNDSLRNNVLRLIKEAEEQLTSGQVYTAQRIHHRSRVAWESRSILSNHDELGAGEEFQIRKRFPEQLSSADIVAYLSGRMSTMTPPLQEFHDSWLPKDWKTEPLSARTKNKWLFDTVDELRRLNGDRVTYPYASRTGEDRWYYFLKDFFELLGLREMEPKSMERLNARVRAGYYLGFLDPNFTIKFTFIDPKKFEPKGLPLIIWHRPNDPNCPSPANLQGELDKRQLDNKAMLVFAVGHIPPEARLELQRANSSAALLDERDLLEVIFSGVTPEERRTSLSRIITRQLPIEQTMPYTLQGDVTSAMFAGRKKDT